MRGQCTPEQIAECPLQQHFSDTHHEYWPRNMYRDGLGKTFRELPENKEQLCRNEHNQRHEESPPPRPGKQQMIQAIAAYAMSQLEKGA